VLTLPDLPAFICCMITILIVGLIDAIMTSGFYGIISYLPAKYIILMNFGQGVSGIIFNIVKYILLASLGDPKNQSTIDLGAIIFYAISLLITLFTLFSIFWVYKQPFFIYKLRNSGEFPLNNTESIDLDLLKDQKEENTPNLNENELSMKDLMKPLVNLNIAICLTYIITYTNYPGLTLAINLL
jgi:hypothetical protein